ncbi:hypothetical protein WDU94_006404 [Cyamophila willieti]
MKRELRLAQSEQDCVELSLIAMSQELKAQQELSASETSLMACKIQDLTLKLSQAEKQVRAFRHKMSKLETRDKRHRSLSLKSDGKESLSLCKELEEKLFQLEGKLNQLERGGVNTDKLSTLESHSSSKMTRLRRKSLDSVNEQTNIDPMKILFRVTDLEKRINKASTGFSPMSQIDEKPRQLPSISRDEVDSRPSPTSAVVILNENNTEQSIRGSEQSRSVPKLTRQNSGDSTTTSPVKPKFNISSSSAVDEVTSRDALRSLPNEYEVSRAGNELLRSINEDESAHASLLNSIEYEVSQIESLVREHNVSLNDLDLSRADSSSSLNDSAWIADLSAKCGEIKQQIVSLQECLKSESGSGGGVVCTRCCSSDDKSHPESGSQGPASPCKQCFEYEHELRKQQEHRESMEKLLQDREEVFCRSRATACTGCKELEEKVRKYKERMERLQDNHPSPSPPPCPQCISLQSELNAQETSYLTSMKQLETLCEANFDKCYQLEALIQDKDKTLVEEIEKKRREHEKKMNELSNEYEEEKEHLISIHEDQIVQFKEKIRTLESRLGTLDSDYGEEISKLRSVYEETLAGAGGAGAQDFGVGSKYKHEMEHVKSLCEKGLQTMELSYRRMIEELKAKHTEEIESLKQEKEQALREETEATLAALDVMRKAHDLEVEKKMNSVMKRMQANHDISTLHTQHQAEMEAIKQDIISLSEKYSAKCVESSDLNERLRQLTRSLTSARAHISELETRNSKLRAHINETNIVTE